MGKLEQYQPQVDLSKQATPYQQSDVPAGAFGQGLGATMIEESDVPRKIYQKERASAAKFMAADAELAYGKTLDKIVGNFRQQGGTDPTVNLDTTLAKLEEERTKIRATLGDSEAVQQFDIATRLQTQAAYRHMDDHAKKELGSWKVGVVQGLYDRATDIQATGNVKDDLVAVRERADTFLPKYADLMREQGLPEEKIQAELRAKSAGIVTALLAGYKDQPQRGMEILNSVFPGSDLSVRQVLGAKAAGDLEAHFRTLDTVNRGLLVGEQAAKTFFDPQKRAFKDAEAEDWINKQFDLKDPNDIRAANEARKQYRALVTEQTQAHAAEITNNYNGVFADFLANGHSLSAVRQLPGGNSRVEWLRTNAPELLDRLENAEERWRTRADRLPPTLAQKQALAQYYTDLGNGVFDGPDGNARFIEDYYGKLHDHDFMREQVNLGHGSAKSEKDPGWLRPVISSLNVDLVRALGHERDGGPVLPNGKPNDKWTADELDLYSAAQEDIRVKAREHVKGEGGRQPPGRFGKDGWQSWVDAWTARGSIKRRFWFDKSATRGQAARAGAEWAPDPDQIPQNERDQIIQSYQAVHKTTKVPSEKYIRDLYQQRMSLRDQGPAPLPTVRDPYTGIDTYESPESADE